MCWAAAQQNPKFPEPIAPSAKCPLLPKTVSTTETRPFCAKSCAREGFLVHIFNLLTTSCFHMVRKILNSKMASTLSAYPHEIVIHNTLLRFTSPLYYDALLLPRILMVTWINWWWDPSLTTNLFSDFSDNKTVTGLSWTTSSAIDLNKLVVRFITYHKSVLWFLR